MAEAIGQHDPIAQNIRPLLEALRDATGETVILGKLQGLGGVYLEIVESKQAVRYTMTVGAVRELHASSIGKAILAAMDQEPRDRLLAKLKYPKITEHTIRSRAQYTKSLEEGRKRGYWTNAGESLFVVLGVVLSVRIFGVFFCFFFVGFLFWWVVCLFVGSLAS